jgi:holo-[acyl-carrier protein] synthase
MRRIDRPASWTEVAERPKRIGSNDLSGGRHRVERPTHLWRRAHGELGLACTNVAGLARIWHGESWLLGWSPPRPLVSLGTNAMAQLTADHVLQSSLRIGVDLIRVADVARSLARFGHRYTERVFTTAERQYCAEDGARSAERYAARFAAKEAALKVLRPSPTDGVSWHSIEVRRLSDGGCEIDLHGGARALAARDGIAELCLSMSHEGEYATATVVARIVTPNSE